MRKNRGITLIALIITIIILLILVGVSVNLLIKGDLFGSAEKAVNGTNAKVEEEQTRVDELMGKLEDVNAKNSKHNWQYTDSTRAKIRCTCEKCKAFNDGDSTGRTLSIGQQIGETESKTASTSITSAKSGDESDQTLTLNAEETKWVVFGYEDKDKDGLNEVLLLTTEHPTTNKIYFGGAAGYNNAVEEINRMCKELYGTNARGMTIEDVNNCLQYTPPAGMCVKNSDDNYTCYNVPKGTKISELGTNYGDVWTDIQNNASKDESGTKIYYTPEKINGTTNASELGNIEINGYEYGLSSDGTYLINLANQTDTSNTITTVTKNVIFGTSTDYSYWLASRGVAAISSCARFGPGGVYEGSAGSAGALFDSDGSSRSRKPSLRAVVSLRSDIPAVVE